MTQIRTILIPIDFSADSAKALEEGIGFAKAFGAKLHLLHCYQINVGGVSPYGLVLSEDLDREVRETAERGLDEWRGRVAAGGVEIETAVTPHFPSEAISKTAGEIGADLIVMGTRGLTGLKHVLLGSVAERTIRIAPCPVLTVKSSGAE